MIPKGEILSFNLYYYYPTSGMLSVPSSTTVLWSVMNIVANSKFCRLSHAIPIIYYNLEMQRWRLKTAWAVNLSDTVHFDNHLCKYIEHSLVGLVLL